MGAHQPLEEPGDGDHALGVDVHLTGHAQPIDLRVQRTQAVGQGLRQHRHDAPGEVDGCAPLPRFGIERATGRNVVRYVRNRDDHPPAGADRFAKDRVVEILGVGPVDRDQRQLAQILATLLGRRRHAAAESLGLGGHLVGKFMGNTMAADRNLGLDAGRIRGPEHLLYPPDGLVVAAGLIEQFGDHDLTGFSASRMAGADRHGVGNPAVVRNHEANSALASVAADDLLGVALEDLDQLRLGAAAVVRCPGPDRDPVAVHHFAHLPGRKVEVIPAFVGYEETVAVPVSDDPPGHDVETIDEAVAPPPVGDDLPVANHGAQTPRHGRLLLAGRQVKGAVEVLGGDR